MILPTTIINNVKVLLDDVTSNMVDFLLNQIENSV